MSVSYRQNEKLIKKIEPLWNGLFRVLCNEGRQLYLANIWIQTTMESGYLEHLNWESLLRDLKHLEPTVDNSALILKPLFVLLTYDLQRNLLAMLYEHRQMIDIDVLREFLSAIKDYVTDDNWTEKLYDKLKESLGCSRDSVYSNRYCVDDSNKLLYEKVICNHLKANTFPLYRKKEEIIPGVSEKNKVDEDSPDLFGETDNEMSIKHEQQEHMNIPKPNTSAIILPGEDNSCSIVISSDEEEPVSVHTKKRKFCLDSSSIEADLSKKPKKQDDEEISQPVDRPTLSQELKKKLSEFKDSLLSGDSTENIHLLTESSPEQIRMYLEYLDLWRLEEESLFKICEYLKERSDILTYDTVVLFLMYTFKPKFSQIQQAPSRTLTSLISEITQTFPKQILDVIMCVITESGINSTQCDILNRLIKDDMKENHYKYLLRSLVLGTRELTENTISILQSLIDQKVEMVPDVTSNLIGCLSASALNLANSQKFGKFLLHFINKYGQKWSPIDLSRIQVVLDRHQSFLKKAALLSFKKLIK